MPEVAAVAAAPAFVAPAGSAGAAVPVGVAVWFPVIFLIFGIWIPCIFCRAVLSASTFFTPEQSRLSREAPISVILLEIVEEILTLLRELRLFVKSSIFSISDILSFALLIASSFLLILFRPAPPLVAAFSLLKLLIRASTPLAAFSDFASI